MPQLQTLLLTSVQVNIKLYIQPFASASFK